MDDRRRWARDGCGDGGAARPPVLQEPQSRGKRGELAERVAGHAVHERVRRRKDNDEGVVVDG